MHALHLFETRVELVQSTKWHMIFLLLLSIQRQQRRVEAEPSVGRLFRDRLNPLEVFRPEQVRRKLRFWPNQIRDILDKMHDEIKPETARSQAVPAMIKLCCTPCIFMQAVAI